MGRQRAFQNGSGRRAFPHTFGRRRPDGKAYGVFDEDAGVETRSRFIMDPESVCQGFEVLTPPVGRNVNETLRQIQAFQLVRNTKGAEAAPSG